MLSALSVLAAALISLPTAASAADKFELTGTLIGYEDSTVIYLYKNSTHLATLIDSARLINNTFHFNGRLERPVMQVILRIKGSMDERYFWLENRPVRFHAEKGKFREAVITGSDTENEQRKFDGETANNKEKIMAYIRSHPSSIISALNLAVYASTWGKDVAGSLYDALSDEMKKTEYGRDAHAFITLNKSPQVGAPYVDFTEFNTKGHAVSLSDFAGKIVLLEFWGSWCGPCRKNNPQLVKLYNEFHGKGFEILGVGAEMDKKEWMDAIETDGLIWPNVTDFQNFNNKAALIYGVNKYPTSYLIDRSGIIVAMDLEMEALKKKLQELLD
jgi:peroxiredoxin